MNTLFVRIPNMKCAFILSLLAIIFLFYLAVSIFLAIFNFAKKDPDIYPVIVKDIVYFKNIKKKYLTVFDPKTIRDEISFYCCIHSNVRIGQKILISFTENGWAIYSNPDPLNTFN